MSLYPELDNLTLQDLIARFRGLAPDEDDYAFSYYAEVATLIREHGHSGVDFLHQEVSEGV